MSTGDVEPLGGARDITPRFGRKVATAARTNTLTKLWSTKAGRITLAGVLAIVFVVVSLARRQEQPEVAAEIATATTSDDPFASYGSSVLSNAIPNGGFEFTGSSVTTSTMPTTSGVPDLEATAAWLEWLNQFVSQLPGAGAASPGGGEASPGLSQPSSPVEAAPVAQVAPATPAPKEPAKRPAPAPPKAGVRGQVAGGFNRSAIAGNALWAPVQGKPGTFKSVPLTDTTDAQIIERLGYARNAGALAAGWVRNPDGAVRWNG